MKQSAANDKILKNSTCNINENPIYIIFFGLQNLFELIELNFRFDYVRSYNNEFMSRY